MKPWHDAEEHRRPFSEAELLYAARNYIMEAYPNPTRIGCPGRDYLNSLARRRSLLGGEEVDHITTCSPCFTEYCEIRTTTKRKRRALIAVACLIAIGPLLGIRFLLHPFPAITSQDHMATKTSNVPKAIGATLDLRLNQPMRGSSVTKPLERPLPLRRAVLNLTILLPIGSEKGRYLLTLKDLHGKERVSASADAIIQDYITEVTMLMDLSSLRADTYTLTIQRSTALAITSYTVEVK